MKINSGGKAWIAGSFMALVLALAGALETHFEGVVYKATPDPAGHGWFICFGHTKGVKPGDTASPAQCDEYLREDNAENYAIVNRCITAPLTVPQAAAFVDAVHNLGQQVVCGSTLQRLANSGHVVAACEQLPRWNHPLWLKGLTTRRGDETDLCTEGLQ